MNYLESNQNLVEFYFEQIKLINESPQVFIDSFSVQLMNEVYYAVKEKIIQDEELSQQDFDEINYKQDQMIYRIEVFKQDCKTVLENQELNRAISNRVNRLIQIFENKIENRLNIDPNFETYFYSELNRLKKILFVDQTILFVAENQILENKTNNFGTLFLINSYLNEKEAKNLVNCYIFYKNTENTFQESVRFQFKR